DPGTSRRGERATELVRHQALTPASGSRSLGHAMERTIRNCAFKMKVLCPRTWGALEETETANVRHCSQCNKDVYFCSSDVETIAHARQGHCIAREVPTASELPGMEIGEPEEPITETPEQLEAEARLRREEGIATLINGRIDASSWECSRCGYPVPDFR